MPRIYTRSLCNDSEEQGKLIPLDVQLLCGHVRDAQRTLLNFFQRVVELRKDLTGERHVLQHDTLNSWQQQLQQIEQMAKHDVDEFFRGIEDFLQHAAESDSMPYETFTHNKSKPYDIIYAPSHAHPRSSLLQLHPISTSRSVMHTACLYGRRYA